MGSGGSYDEGTAMFLSESRVTVEDSYLQGLVTILAGPNSDHLVCSKELESMAGNSK